MKNIKIYCCFFILIFCIGTVSAQWTELNTGLVAPLRTASAVDDNIVWVAGGTTNVFRTTNGGANWTNVTGTGMRPRNATCIFATDANNALLGTGDPQLIDTACIYKTTNGGVTWQLTWASVNTFIDGLYMKSSTNAFFVGDPDCSNCSMVLRKSTDGGSSWTTASTSVQGDYGTSNSIYGIGDAIWFGGGSLVYYSTNFGSNWTSQPAQITNGVYAVFFENTLTGMCGGTGKLSYTTNSGVSWANVTYPGTGTVNGIAGYGSVWIVSKIGRNVYITTDNGSTWNTDYTIPQTATRNFMTKSRNGSKLWDVRDDGTVGRRDSPVGIEQLGGTVPEKFGLSQNFPNPFNPETKIVFSIPHNVRAIVSVYDVTGRLVSVLADRDFSAGNYQLSFNAASLASGVYYYKFESEDFTSTRKMILLK